MKKADPFTGIPAVPNSLAAQWLAYSHMANHYRKLLNVKPRVDSSAFHPSSAIIVKNSYPLSPYYKQTLASKPLKPSTKCIPSTKKVLKESSLIKSKVQKSSYPPELEEYGYPDSADSFMGDNSKRTKNKANVKIKTKQMVSNSSPQFFYGPASLKSSTDGLTSEFEHEETEDEVSEPRVETMGVQEKIKVFLQDLHHFSNNVPKKSTKPKAPPKVGKRAPLTTPINQVKSQGAAMKSKSVEIQLNARQSRHSKCFLPTNSTTTTPRKNSNLKQGSKITAENSKPKSAPSTPKKGTLANMVAAGTGKIKRRGRGDSFSSVGTIRGSEELTAEDEILEIHLAKGVARSQTCLKSSPRTSAGYCSQSAASGKATSLSSATPNNGVIPNNNDSSRDSAYGFSSGESRMASTRESTPEKLKKVKSLKGSGGPNGENNVSSKTRSRKYRSALSTVASSVNADSANYGDHREMRREMRSEDNYLSFLTEVTEDIISRGIYTNRGLKSLFKEHLHQKRAKGLDPSRLNEMLEKLRLDLGIPKDDSLNKLEFGYGSVMHASDSYFYKNGANPTHPVKEKPDKVGKLVHRGSRLEAVSDEYMAPPPPVPSLFVLGERKASYAYDEDDDEEFSVRSELSLTESEMKATLKEVGIDSDTAIEIVDIMSSNKKRPSESGSITVIHKAAGHSSPCSTSSN